MKNIYQIIGLRSKTGCSLARLPGQLLSIAMLVALPVIADAQSGLCDPTTPFFTVDLTASPNAVWTSPSVIRNDNCCGTVSPDRCIEFEITLNSGTVAINFDIASGAVPSGSMFYQINCGPMVPVGTPICISGTGPQTLTFCKPGNNTNTYAITAIPEPSVGPPVYASSTCPAGIWVQGLVDSTIVWTDVTYGGMYDSYLSCTNCPNPLVTPMPGHPAYVDYLVCGSVLAGGCGGIPTTFCDTVRVYMFDPLQATVNPNPAVFCAGSTGVQLTASSTGGYGTIQYSWYDQGWNPVGTGTGYFASSAGTYYLIVTDDMSSVCPSDTVSVNVSQGSALVSVIPGFAGICEGSSVTLTASGAQNYVWSPATGLSAVTGSTVVASPVVTTTYTVTGTDALGCTGTATSMIEIFPVPVIDAGPNQAICLGQSAQLQGSGALIYEWTPAATLNNPNISNPIATPAVTTTYYLTGYSVGGNIINNGDFEAGNTGFTTDYLYDPNLFPEGNYYVTNNPNSQHPNFSACADHTPAPGNLMMVINGAPIANQEVWCENISVVPNTDYAFGTWVTSVHPTNPAVLQFSINGSLLGTPFTATSTTCLWQQFYEVWNSGANTTAQICIVNQNIIRNGNDFALDDILFSPLCSNVDSVTVTVNPNPVLTITPSATSICNGSSATLTVSSNIAGTTFVWNTGAVTSTITVNPTTTTTYQVTGTSASGCTGTASIQIIVNPLPVVSVTTTDGNICVGESTTLTATSSIAGSTYLWSNGATTPVITVSPVSTTTYNVTVTSPQGCVSTGSVIINVFPNPVLTLTSSATSICNGSSATLTVSSNIAGTTFVWNTGAVTSTITVNPTTTTTYQVTGTSANGCTGIASIQIVVNPLPVVSVTTTDGNICVGETTTLTATSSIAGSTYLWSNGAVTPVISVSPTTTTTYNVTVTSPQGCVSTGSVIINVFPNPVLTLTSSATSICNGSSATLTVSSNIAGTTFVWNTGAVTSTITVNPTTTTTYQVTGTSANGCTGIASIQIVVNPVPVVSVTATNGSLCVGENTTLTVSSNIAGTTFVWNTGAVTSTITVNPTTTSTYQVTGTSASGCTGTASIQIVVNPLPVVSVTTTDGNICVGESTTLTATSSIAGSTYEWSNGAVTPVISVSPTTTTTYNVTVTSPQGCVSTGSVIINVFPNPVLTLTSSATSICNGSSATLTVSSNIAGTTFVWNTGAVTSTITVNPTITTTYQVTGTSANGCTGIASIQIVVNPLPVVSVTTTDDEICEGETVVINAFSDIANSAFVWSNGASSSQIVVSPTATTTYYVTVTSPQGCTSTINTTITVNPNPVPVIVASSTTLCVGATATLTCNTNIAVSTYMWNTAENTPTINVSPTSSTDYMVTVTTASGCSGEAVVSIIVNTVPAVSINAPAGSICLGSSLLLTATSDHPSTTFTWSTGQTGSNITVTPASVTTYAVTGTDMNGCTDIGQFMVIVNPLPVITINTPTSEICFGSSLELVAGSNMYNTTYQWSTGANTASIIVSPQVQTTYSVTGTDANGCTGMNSTLITVNPNPVVQVGPGTVTICPGDTVTLTATSATAGVFEWNTGATTASITVWPLSTTIYSVTGTDSKGCIGVGTASVVVRNAPVITVIPDDPVICQGESVTLIASGAVLYDWNPVYGLNTNVGAVVIATPDTTTTYTVAGVDLYGCLGDADVTVVVHPVPTVDFVADETNICMATVVHFSGQAAPSIQSWQWDFGDPASGASNNSSLQNPMHAYFETGTYTVGLEVTTTAGCKNAIQKPSYIIVHPNPIAVFARTPDITTLEYPTIQFYNQSLGEEKLLWNFDDPGSGYANISQNENPTHTYSAEGEYWVTLFVENEWGCFDSVSNRIIINPTWDEYIPTAFSPNDDGNNDFFRPMGFNIDFTEYSMYIYDRWGKEIFESHDIEEAWDGRVHGKGETVQQDVYVYLIILMDVTGLEHQFIGHVTVLK